MKPLLALLLLLVLAAHPAAATRYVAPDGTDAGDCTEAETPCATFAYALSQSADGDVIEAAAGTYDEAGITLDRDVTLRGAGAGVTIVDAGRRDRVVRILPGVRAAIEALTLQNGRAQTADLNGGGLMNEGYLLVADAVIRSNVAEFGGGVYNGPSGVLQLVSSDVANNRDDAFGGGGGGLYNRGTAVLTHTTVYGNVVGDFGGGGILNGTDIAPGLLIAEHSTVRDNEALSGAGIGNWSGTVLLRYSTVRSNRVSGLYCSGGGIDSWQGHVAVAHSTISGNAVEDCLEAWGGGITSGGSLAITHSTIAGNRIGAYSDAGAGGGLYVRGEAVVRNTVLADNTDEGRPSDCDGTLRSRGFNLVGTLDGCTLLGAEPSDLVGLEPLLLPLGDYGGPTWTHDLAEASPAVDAGTCVALGGRLVPTDQRGFARPDGGACDVGSVERGAAASYLLLTLAPSVAPVVVGIGGGSVTLTATVTNTSNAAVETDVWLGIAALATAQERTRGPVTLVLAPGETQVLEAMLRVPATAPADAYLVDGYVGTFPDDAVATAGFVIAKVEDELARPADGPVDAVGDWSFDAVGEAAAAGPTRAAEVGDVAVANHPNPFNPVTTFTFILPAERHVRLAIYDVLGREVAVVVDGLRAAGPHTARFDASALGSGVYVYVLLTGGVRVARTMVLLE